MSPAPAVTPNGASSSDKGGRGRREQLGEGLPVHREVLVSHHELEIVNDHVGDVVHVDSMLHGVNHCPGWRETRISWDQPQGCTEVRRGMLRQEQGWGMAERGGTRLVLVTAGRCPPGPGHIPPPYHLHCRMGQPPNQR